VTLYLHGVGHFHPENVIDNAFLEALEIDTNDQWILERVGIRSRRTVLALDYIQRTRNSDPRAATEASQYSNAQTGAKAATLALERAGLQPEDIGMVISGSCSPQWSIPAEACLVAAELGIEAQAFDLNSACSSFVAQLHLLNQMRPEALPDYILTVIPENNTRTVDYNDRRTAVLWGDGTAAAVVSTRVSAPACITTSSLNSSPKSWDKVVIPVAGHFTQQGSAVQAFAIRRTVATLEALRERASNSEEAPYFIGHQANLLMLESSCRRAQVTPSRHLYNVDAFGNCGASGAPTVLSQHWEQFVTGDALAMVVVGAGLSWSGVWLQFR